MFRFRMFEEERSMYSYSMSGIEALIQPLKSPVDVLEKVVCGRGLCWGSN